MLGYRIYTACILYPRYKVVLRYWIYTACILYPRYKVVFGYRIYTVCILYPRYKVVLGYRIYTACILYPRYKVVLGYRIYTACILYPRYKVVFENSFLWDFTFLWPGRFIDLRLKNVLPKMFWFYYSLKAHKITIFLQRIICFSCVSYWFKK